MKSDEHRAKQRRKADPRVSTRSALPIAWPVPAALLFVIALFIVLPDSLRVGPGALVPVLMLAFTVLLALLIGIEHYYAPGHPSLREWSRRVSIGLLIGMTVAVAFSALYLVQGLPKREVEPLELLVNGAVIWVINVLVFTAWYWEIDDGGPYRRHEQGYACVDFVFPQFSAGDAALAEGWSPNFVDYGYLAFNTSTAFSPSDTMVLSHWAKCLMMLQSLIALVVSGALLARAIGTL